MTPDKAKSLVLLGTIGAGTLTAVASVSEHGTFPGPRVGFGVFVSGVLLTAVAEASPDVAAGLATVMLITAALVLGGPAWSGISNIVSTNPRKGKQ